MAKRGARYCGAFDHTLDPKFRVTVPSRFREVLELKGLRPRLVILPGMQAYLILVDEDEFDDIENNFESSSFASEEAADFERFLYGMAEDASLDSMGRLLIPERLRLYAGIDRDVTLVGVRNRIEIWDRERWKERSASAQGNFVNNAAVVFGSQQREGK